MIKKPIIIAEIGVNHNGSIQLAKKLIILAAKAKADYVKFQTYKTEKLVSTRSTSAQYQKRFLGKKKSQFSMLKKYELTMENHLDLINQCIKSKIKFLSSPFDLESIDLLNKLKLKTIKIPSGEINNFPYLMHLGRLNKKIILSTGMSNLNEIKAAIKTLINSGTLKRNISVLHCTSEYPTPFKNANLSAIKYLKKELKCDIGYSDHTKGFLASICAVSLGATIIEKHITLDEHMSGPDHEASLNINLLAKFVQDLKNIPVLLGDKVKKITKAEKNNMKHIRKSIFANEKIKKGEKFNKKNLTSLRPGKYISVSNWHDLIRKKSKYNFEPGDPIKIK